MSEFDVILENVSKTYPGGARAVIDFSAELKHGEFVSMLGPSGCGKTTTLRMIGGLEEVTEGKIFIADKDVTDLPPARRRQVGDVLIGNEDFSFRHFLEAADHAQRRRLAAAGRPEHGDELAVLQFGAEIDDGA